MSAIAPPDFDLRRGILLRKALDRGVDLPDDVATFLAERIVGGGRTLEGALNRVQAFAQTEPGPTDDLTRSVAAKALEAFETPRVSTTPEFIGSLVVEVLAIPTRILTSRKKTREATRARQLAMYLSRRFCKLPLTVLKNSSHNWKT